MVGGSLISSVIQYFVSELAEQTARKDIDEARERIKLAEVRELEASARIAEANSKAAEAQQKASNADQNVTQAQLLIATLRADANRFRLETAQFQASFAWRVLQPQQFTAMSTILLRSPGSIEINFVGDDPETTYFVIQIEQVFKKADWSVLTSANSYPGSVIFGISIPGPENDAVTAVRQAFTAAKLQFFTSEPPSAVIRYSVITALPPDVRITIGAKTPPVPPPIPAVP